VDSSFAKVVGVLQLQIGVTDYALPVENNWSVSLSRFWCPSLHNSHTLHLHMLRLTPTFFHIRLVIDNGGRS